MLIHKQTYNLAQTALLPFLYIYVRLLVFFRSDMADQTKPNPKKQSTNPCSSKIILLTIIEMGFMEFELYLHLVMLYYSSFYGLKKIKIPFKLLLKFRGQNRERGTERK